MSHLSSFWFWVCNHSLLFYYRNNSFSPISNNNVWNNLEVKVIFMLKWNWSTVFYCISNCPVDCVSFCEALALLTQLPLCPKWLHLSLENGAKLGITFLCDTIWTATDGLLKGKGSSCQQDLKLLSSLHSTLKRLQQEHDFVEIKYQQLLDHDMHIGYS